MHVNVVEVVPAPDRPEVKVSIRGSGESFTLP